MLKEENASVFVPGTWTKGNCKHPKKAHELISRVEYEKRDAQ